MDTAPSSRLDNQSQANDSEEELMVTPTIPLEPTLLPSINDADIPTSTSSGFFAEEHSNEEEELSDDMEIRM